MTEIKNFVLHLRLNYQLFILSGPFLLGVLLSKNFSEFQLVQFFSIHILLFGGVTAYNSYFDKDEGPIGGLEQPPKMDSWMLVGSWVLQVIGLGIAFYSGLFFTTVYMVSMFIFWMYSSPHVRLKGKPKASLVAIGVSTAFCSVLLGYFSGGTSNQIPPNVIIAALGATSLIVSLYPLSQVYQVEEDRKRGDSTFASKYGKRGVKKLFFILFPIGAVTVSAIVGKINLIFGAVFFIGSVLFAVYAYKVISAAKMDRSDYKQVMRVKYLGGMAFTLVMSALILVSI